MTRSNFCAALSLLNIIAMPASTVWALVVLIAFDGAPCQCQCQCAAFRTAQKSCWGDSPKMTASRWKLAGSKSKHKIKLFKKTNRST
jgi:hypothetical protein